MAAVTLNPGKYYVGNPKSVFPDWVPNDSCSYKTEHLNERGYPIWWHAFQYGGTTWVAAIPYEVIPKNLLIPQTEEVEDEDKKKKHFKKIEPLTFVTFNEDVVFYEADGVGKIGEIDL